MLKTKEANPYLDGVQLGPVRVYGRPCVFDPRVCTLLVGEAPNRWMHQNPGREHVVLAREDLAELAGLSLLDYLRTFARCNLLDRWPGAQKGDRARGGSAFPLEEARPRAEKLREAIFEPSSPVVRVVLLGRRVAAAFDREGRSRERAALAYPFFRWWSETRPGSKPVRWVVVPHPSKTSRWWNDAANVAQARLFWRGLRAEIGQPWREERIRVRLRGGR